MSSAPTAPARPRCCRSPSAQIHPTSGVAGILDEVLGTVDVFDLRPRIGLTSAALAERIPRDERVHDVVVSASYGVVGRWREAYDDLDHGRAAELLAEVGVEAPRGPHVRHAQRGRAQAGADRPGPDDRPGAAAARRAGGRASTSAAARTSCRRSVLANDPRLAGDGAGLPPRRGDPAGLHPRAAAARRAASSRRAARRRLTEENLSATFGMPLRLSHGGRPLRRASPNTRTASRPPRIGFRHGLVGGERVGRLAGRLRRCSPWPRCSVST